MLNPLDRPQTDYVWAMEQFALVSNLSPAEQSIVDNLVQAARSGREDFDAMRHIAANGRFREVLISAVGKARAAGIGKEWKQ